MGKGGQKETAPANDVKKEVLINGRFYDVTNLKHPGGNVINFYAGKGIDASQAFANFHVRSKKAKKYMDVLPSRPADVKPSKAASLLEDFDKFTRELEDEGYFKPSIPHIIYRISELVIMHVLGFWLLLNGYPLPGLILLGLGTGRCGWLMHEGGHYSLTGKLFSAFLEPN